MAGGVVCDGVRDVPRRPAGVVPAGALRDGGFEAPQWLVRRDGRFVQVPELLYRLVELADGRRSREEIAEILTAATQWHVTPEDVSAIIARRLEPLGLVTEAREPPQRPAAVSPLLINARVRLVGPRAIDRAAAPLRHLHRPPVLAAALVLIVLGQAWMFLGGGGARAAMSAVVASPASLLVLTALLLAAAVLHELGHAAALRYGGGRARAMGAGFYLAVPVLYTDVTDSYRLSRSARLRTDLGGFYFHLLAATALIAGHAATGQDVLLATAFLIDLEIARQLIPVIRLDGYWVLADLTGIPDLYAHAWPRLHSRLRPHRREAVAPLRPGVARVFTAYATVALPIVLALLAYIAWSAPAIVRAAADVLRGRMQLLADAVMRGDPWTAALAGFDVLLTALPAAGLAALAYVLVRAATTAAWRGTRAGTARG